MDAMRTKLNKLKGPGQYWSPSAGRLTISDPKSAVTSQDLVLPGVPGLETADAILGHIQHCEHWSALLTTLSLQCVLQCCRLVLVLARMCSAPGPRWLTKP